MDETMTAIEFRAWMKEFTEGMNGPPNTEQWELIKKRADSITAEPAQIIYRDRWNWSRPWYDNGYVYNDDETVDIMLPNDDNTSAGSGISIMNLADAAHCAGKNDFTYTNLD